MEQLKHSPCRKDFGPGIAGQQAFDLIVLGAKCEVKVGERGQICGKDAVEVVQFDVPIVNDRFDAPTCGHKHSELFREQILVEFKKNGYPHPSFDVNGLGRS